MFNKQLFYSILLSWNSVQSCIVTLLVIHSPSEQAVRGVSHPSRLDLCWQVAGRLQVELLRVSGVVPERLAGGDDSSENSSESSGYEVMDNNGEIVHMARKLTCRVNTQFIYQSHLCMWSEFKSFTTTCTNLHEFVMRSTFEMLLSIKEKL